jgi:hypothetical protein
MTWFSTAKGTAHKPAVIGSDSLGSRCSASTPSPVNADEPRISPSGAPPRPRHGICVRRTGTPRRACVVYEYTAVVSQKYPGAQVRRPSAMQRSRLFATLLSLSLGFQLALAAVGMTCVMPSGGATHVSGAATSQMDMAGMDMAGMDMAGMDMAGMPSGEDKTPSSHSHGPDGAPCEQPGTPEACQVMAPCAGAFVAVTPSRARASADVPAAVLAVSVVTPPSRTIPPELPPPRA